MLGTGRALLTAILLVVAVATGFSAANFPPPEWAYPSTPRDFKPAADDGKPKRLVGSTKTHTYAQIQDPFAAPDWYPTEHPKMPEVPVAKGRRPDVRACASCHLTNGLGHPQSGNLAGLTAEYMRGSRPGHRLCPAGTASGPERRLELRNRSRSRGAEKRSQRPGHDSED